MHMYIYIYIEREREIFPLRARRPNGSSPPKGENRKEYRLYDIESVRPEQYMAILEYYLYNIWPGRKYRLSLPSL